MGEDELAKFLRKTFGVDGQDFTDVAVAVDRLGVLPFRVSEALLLSGRIAPADAAFSRPSGKFTATVRMTYPRAIVGAIDGSHGRARVFVAARTQRPWEWYRASPDFRLLSVADGDAWLIVSRLAGYGRIMV